MDEPKKEVKAESFSIKTRIVCSCGKERTGILYQKERDEMVLLIDSKCPYCCT